uniref:Retrotransposon gag domain-containing protein n=1 Tax=Lactuca sativa TaxID=4236 RepID=A0A9R1VY19_LACSA|nr:hypothetical protein LSAT_V11C400158930 [Lactuca sativa]
MAEYPTRRQPTHELHRVEDVKLEFVGGNGPERYLDRERKFERMFEFKELNDEKCYEYVIMKFSGGASLWFDGLKAKRTCSLPVWEDPNFLDVLRDTLRNMVEDPTQRQPIHGLHRVEDIKVTELPKFVGGTDLERYLEWEIKIERMFEFKDLNNEKCCKYAILKFSGGASLWFEGLKTKRTREEKEKISS